MTTTNWLRQEGRLLLLQGMFVLLLLAAMALRPGAVIAAASGPTWRACLSCHENAGLSLTTAKGETISLTVTVADLAGSAHRGVECRGCHPGVKLDAHPDGHAVASLDEYRLAASRVIQPSVCAPGPSTPPSSSKTSNFRVSGATARTE